MSTSASLTLKQDSSRHAWFIAFLVVSSLVFRSELSALFRFSMVEDYASHIVLVPLIVAFLLFTERRRIFAVTRSGAAAGIALIGIGVLLYWLGGRASSQLATDYSLSLQSLAVVILWIGGFLFCYGIPAARAATFSLLFLLLMVPLPVSFVDRIIYWLQAGSTELTYLIFQMVGTPVLRDGFFLTVPGVTIEVAKECSSIRSSIALFITCLLAAHMYLRSAWRQAFFVLLSLVVSIVKNGIRIATLTLLSIHVDRGFLTGKLHQQGGFVFFLIALGILFPVLMWLQKSERVAAFPVDVPSKLDPGLVR